MTNLLETIDRRIEEQREWIYANDYEGILTALRVAVVALEEIEAFQSGDNPWSEKLALASLAEIAKIVGVE